MHYVRIRDRRLRRPYQPPPNEPPRHKLDPPSESRAEWRRLSGEQLEDALADLELNYDILARIRATRPSRVREWAEGRREIPLDMDILLALLHLPGAPGMLVRVLGRNDAELSDTDEAILDWARRRGEVE